MITEIRVSLLIALFFSYLTFLTKKGKMIEIGEPFTLGENSQGQLEENEENK